MKKLYLFIPVLIGLFTGFTCAVHAQTIFTRNLSTGSTGSDVVQLQNLLIASGFLTMPAGTSEGYFGGLTKQALVRYQSSKDIQPASGYFGPITRTEIAHDAETSTLSQPITIAPPPAFVCPVEYSSCTTATSTSLSVTQGSVSLPVYSTGNTNGTYGTGNTAATWTFAFTVSSTSSLPIYISATPSSALQIGTDLPGVPGVSGLAAATMPTQIVPSGSAFSGDTAIGSGVNATGSFIIPPNSSRSFSATVIEDNFNNPNADGSASVQISGIYYNSSPTLSGKITPASSEALYPLNLQSLHSTPVTLQGNDGSEFSTY